MWSGAIQQRQPTIRGFAGWRSILANKREGARKRLTRVVGPIRKLCIAAALVAGAGSGVAQACRENAMVVFDSSSSMALFREGRRKIDLARQAVGEVLPEVTPFRPTGLVTYSGGFGPACTDVILRGLPQRNSSARIVAELAGLQPNGATPLTDAVELAAATLRQLGEPGIVVLITDGLETCGRDACQFAQQLQASASNIRVHVIAFHLHGEAVETVKCLAGHTGGTYASTQSLDGLRKALRKALSCPRISRAAAEDTVPGSTAAQGAGLRSLPTDGHPGLGQPQIALGADLGVGE